MVVFPLEIQQRCIYELQNDRKSLIACCSVSPAFQNAAERRLFQSIHLTDQGHTLHAQAEALVRFLPRVRDYIRKITVELRPRSCTSAPVQQLFLSLRVASQLEHLGVRGLQADVAVNHFVNQLMTTKTLLRIDLSRIARVPDSLFARQPSLQQVSFSNVLMSNHRTMQSNLPTFADFTFSKKEGESSKLSLTELGVRLRTKSCVSSFAEIILCHGQSIIKLTIVLSGFLESQALVAFQAIDLGCMPSLEEVTLILGITPVRHNLVPRVDIRAFLNDGNATNIKRFNFQLVCRYDSNVNSSDVLFGGRPVSEVVQLSRHPKFVSATAAVLVRPMTGDGPCSEADKNLIERHLEAALRQAYHCSTFDELQRIFEMSFPAFADM